jgi:tetratricopeptide (TPR) repeat protein
MFSLANEDFEKAFALAPNWHWSRLTHALGLQKQGRLREAVAVLDKAIDAGYTTVSIFRLRGELLTQLSDPEGAKRDFTLALDCVPTTDKQWVDRGLIRLTSNPAGAAEDFLQALVVNPNHVDAHQKLAYVYHELLNNPEKSLEHSNQLVKLAPSQPTHLAGRAVLHARASRTQLALADLQTLETMRVQDPIEVYQVACGYSLLAGDTANPEPERNGFSKSAFRWFTKAVDADKNILAIAMTEPDVQWMRQQAQFQEIAQAVTTLKLNPP